MEFNGPEVVRIKPNPRIGYFGVASYPKSTFVVSCQLNRKGSHNTGLNSSEEKYYEEKLGLKPGELSKDSKWWGEVFNTEFPIRLSRVKSTELTLDSLINQIKYKVILAHSDIANSEIEKSKPGILFFIDDQEAKAKAEMEIINFELEGMKLILGLTTDETKGSLRLFGKPGSDLMSATNAQAQLMQEMKKNPKTFFDIMTDKDLKMKIFIYELVEKKIINRRSNYFIHGDDTIAHSMEECVNYFNDVKNQTVKLTLETRLKKAKKEA